MGSGIDSVNEHSDIYDIENFRKEILYVFDNEDDMNAKEAELVTARVCARRFKLQSKC
jgi:hypothetical protein